MSRRAQGPVTQESPGPVQRARPHLSYAGASDQVPCEGRPASPSNPSSTHKQVDHELTETLVLRCTPGQKQLIRKQAELAGVPVSRLMREAMGLVRARRRKAPAPVSPQLLLSLARIGGNLNQIARALNAARKHDPKAMVDTIALEARMISIERALQSLRQPPPEAKTADGDDQC